MTPLIDLQLVAFVLLGAPCLSALLVVAVAVLPASWQPVAASTLAVLAVCLVPQLLAAA